MKSWLSTCRLPILVLGLAMICIPIAAYGQSTEIAITTGGNFVSNGNFNMGTTWALQGSVAHRFFQSSGLETGRLQLYGELPIAVGKGSSRSATPGGPLVNTLSPEIASIFVTPGVKVKLNVPMVAPYFVVGIGAGHFYAAGFSGETHPVFSYGTGADFNLSSHFALRGEVRDYNSPIPKIAFGGSGRQHNFFVTGGVVFRF